MRRGVVLAFGLVPGMLGCISMWRNASRLVAPIAALKNAVLPASMMCSASHC